MQANPIVVSSDTLLSEAKQIITEHNLHGLPVVDNGQLRGLITRSNCLRWTDFALRTQNINELNFFTDRIRVKDVMVRNPATIEGDDTMEHCLQVGQERGVGQFPVMDRGRVIGMISANEIFSLAAQFLGTWEQRSGVSLAPLELKAGTLAKIAGVIEAAGGEVESIYPLCKREAGQLKPGRKRVVIRFHSDDTPAVVRALEDAGYPVVESVHGVQSTEFQHA
jgi:acetoin utilization protein AcuB